MTAFLELQAYENNLEQGFFLKGKGSFWLRGSAPSTPSQSLLMEAGAWGTSHPLTNMVTLMAG